MKPESILVRYIWTVGVCFRCARVDLLVTVLDVIVTPAAQQYEIAACQECVLTLERQREQYAKRRGLPYLPGQLAQG